jgi:flagella basal body P-ring formation protein FlgA
MRNSSKTPGAFFRSRPRATAGTSILLVAVSLLASLTGLQALELQLRHEAAISAKQIFVGDLLVKHPLTPPEVLAVTMGSTPDYKDLRPITRSMIAMAIKQQLKTDQPITWSGAETCEVTRPTRLVSTRDLNIVLMPALLRITQGKGAVAIEEFSAQTPMLIPVGRARAEVELNANTTNNAWSNATITFMVDGENVLTRSVRFRWSWVADGWMATKALTAGAPLKSDAFSLGKIDLIKSGVNAITEPVLPAEQTLAKPMQSGQVLTTAHIQAKTVVGKGESVLVHLISGALKISMRGVALEDGSLGATIPVMNSLTKKRMLARVVDEQNVDFIQKL